MTVGVFLLDDHEIVRQGLRHLLEAEPDIDVVGEAGTAEEALVRIPATGPQVAVLDVRLGEDSGIEVCREVRSANPEIACLMLTSFADDEALVAAVMAGAAGYVLKNVGGGDLVRSIRTVAAGGSLIDPASMQRLLAYVRTGAAPKADDPTAALSGQESRILDLIAEGCTNREIADELCLSEKTVKNYVSNLLAKLGVSRRTEAAVLAVQREMDRDEHPRSRP